MDVLERSRVSYPDTLWYDSADAVVFAAVYRAVSAVPFLSDTVSMLQGQAEATQKAWRAIKAHYLVQSQYAQVEIRSELSGIRLQPDEQMDSFLSRNDQLMVKAAAMGFSLRSDDVILTVMALLPRTWGKAVEEHFDRGTPYSSMDWATVRLALKQEDIERRHHDMSEGHLLPLGLSRRSGGA
jgi:hypothetical protein